MVLPEPDGPTMREGRAGANGEFDAAQHRALRPRIVEIHMHDLDCGARAMRRRRRRGRHSRAIRHQNGLVMHRAQPMRRGKRIGELAADMGDLRNRQESRGGEQSEQRQKHAVEIPACRQQPAGQRHREPAERGRGFELHVLQRNVVQHVEPQHGAIAHELLEFAAPPAERLEGDEFGKSLDGVGDVRIQHAQGLARGGAKPVDPLPQQHWRQGREQQERHERQRGWPGEYSQRRPAPPPAR